MKDIENVVYDLKDVLLKMRKELDKENKQIFQYDRVICMTKQEHNQRILSKPTTTTWPTTTTTKQTTSTATAAAAATTAKATKTTPIKP